MGIYEHPLYEYASFYIKHIHVPIGIVIFTAYMHVANKYSKRVVLSANTFITQSTDIVSLTKYTCTNGCSFHYGRFINRYVFTFC